MNKYNIPPESNVFLDHAKGLGVTEKELYRMFYQWVDSAMDYKNPLELIKSGKIQLEKALEYINENEKEK